jgi:hypothetical protein
MYLSVPLLAVCFHLILFRSSSRGFPRVLRRHSHPTICNNAIRKPWFPTQRGGGGGAITDHSGRRGNHGGRRKKTASQANNNAASIHTFLPATCPAISLHAICLRLAKFCCPPFPCPSYGRRAGREGGREETRVQTPRVNENVPNDPNVDTASGVPLPR